MNNREVLQKLLKIAHNQQRLINKLVEIKKSASDSGVGFESLQFRKVLDGKGAELDFDNGYQISVVRHSHSHGGTKGLYEMLVRSPVGRDMEEWGDLTERDVTDHMQEVASRPSEGFYPTVNPYDYDSLTIQAASSGFKKFKILDVEYVRAETYKVYADAGRDGPLRIIVYPNWMQVFNNNPNLKFFQSDLSSTQQTQVLKAVKDFQAKSGK